MQPENSGVNAREEILSQKRRQEQRADAKRKEENGESKAMLQDKTEQFVIALAETVKSAFEGLLQPNERPNPRRNSRRLSVRLVIYIPFEPHHQCGHESSRQYIRRQHCEYDSFR